MILNYHQQKQILPNWCWAAVTSSVSICFNSDSAWRQQQIAEKVLNVDCSTVSSGNVPDGADNTADIAAALTITDNLRKKQLLTISLEDVIGEITNGNPVTCLIRWENLDMGHFVCIFGFDDDSYDLSIADPEIPKVYIISYDDFCAGYRGGTWQETCLTKPA